MSDRDLENMPVIAGKLRSNGKGRSLILNGHYDVVPPGLMENWSHDPLNGDLIIETVPDEEASNMGNKSGLLTK